MWGHVTLERTFDSRAARLGGHVALVQSVWADTVHRGQAALQQRDIVAVGTDGEQAIVKSLEALFPDNLIHLRCFVYMGDNIRHTWFTARKCVH